MKKRMVLLVAGCTAAVGLFAGEPLGVAYEGQWNAALNAAIDARIERHRKGDAEVAGFAPGETVKVDQISSAFQFGVNIFNFDQFGDDVENARYRAAITNLFNAATVGFYWKNFEPQRGRPRYVGGEHDTLAFWRSVRSNPWPYNEWRRPAPDKVLAFLHEHGLSVHGHVLIYPQYHPQWLQQFASKEEIADLYRRRIEDFAAYYGDTIAQWDVVNESVNRQSTPENVNDDVFWNNPKLNIPPDMTYRCYTWARPAFPANVKLAINDSWRTIYVPFIRKLQSRGAPIDVTGIQMHLFTPAVALKIARGEPCSHNNTSWAPADQLKMFAELDRPGLPIHVSEITIPSPRGQKGVTDAEADAIQARMMRDNYRLWFSWPSVYRITYWNLVDDCGAPGERMSSGLFNRDLTIKPAGETLRRLVHEEWATHLTVQADAKGVVRFRGFKGAYTLTGGQATRVVRVR